MNLPTHRETDIIVVGGGGSGLSAAVEAARFGRRVLLLEKNPILGGTTSRSVGSVTASCTPLQRARQLRDFPQQHFEDMALFADDRGFLSKDNLELRRLLTEHIPDTVDWLASLGVVFFGPMPEPPHRLPRMHNVLPNSRSYIYHLEKEARSRGVDILVDACVLELIREEDHIVGVEADIAGGRQRILARCAVILASGDYSSSKEIKLRYVTEQLADIEGINPTNTGDGHRLIESVGGGIVNGDVMLGPEIRFVAPPRKKLIDRIPPIRPVALLMRVAMRYMPAWSLRPLLMMFVTTNLAPSRKLFDEGAILINQEGERFCNEQQSPELAIPRQPGRLAYIVMDDKVARKFRSWPNFVSTAPSVAYAYLPDYRRNRKDIYFQANSIADLGKKLGVQVEALVKTITQYNQSLPQEAKPIDCAPYHALGPAKSWIVLTDGGARVNSKLQVLGHDGKVIRNLYAVGSVGQGGLLLEGHGHHLGWAFTSGRLAGRGAALGPEVWEDAAATLRNRTVASSLAKAKDLDMQGQVR